MVKRIVWGAGLAAIVAVGIGLWRAQANRPPLVTVAEVVERPLDATFTAEGWVRGIPDRIDGRTPEGCHNPSVATMCAPSGVGRNNGFLVPGVFDPGVIASATPAASPAPVGRLPAARTIRGLPAIGNAKRGQARALQEVPR